MGNFARIRPEWWMRKIDKKKLTQSKYFSPQIVQNDFRTIFLYSAINFFLYSIVILQQTLAITVGQTRDLRCAVPAFLVNFKYACSSYKRRGLCATHAQQ